MQDIGPLKLKRYIKVSPELRDSLVLMVNDGDSISEASKTLGIKYENAKYLCRTYRYSKTGVRRIKKSAERDMSSSVSEQDVKNGGGEMRPPLAKQALGSGEADMSGLRKF